MRVIKTIKPGQNGSRRLLRQYGKKLIKVRYREDKATNSLHTTVELIVDSRAIMPGYISTVLLKRSHQRVAVKKAYQDEGLRARAKTLGARWDNNHKLWIMSYAQADDLGIVDRVISPEELYKAGVVLDS